MRDHHQIYGVDHSPWVQAVLVGLHLKAQDYDLTPLPSLRKLLHSGVRMPALKVDGVWQTESADILEKLGYASADPRDQAMVAATWQGVLHRPDSLLNFFNSFAKVRMIGASGLTRSIRQLLRPLLTIFFYVLIKLALWRLKPTDPENFTEQFKPINERLKSQAFLCGEAPGILDCQQFGIIQCHLSIPHPPLVAAMTADPALKHLHAWMERMHGLLQGYPHLYSEDYFTPHQPPYAIASPGQRAIFWFGVALYLLALPLTLLALVLLTLKPLANR